jgi:hypothetical protein
MKRNNINASDELEIVEDLDDDFPTIKTMKNGYYILTKSNNGSSEYVFLGKQAPHLHYQE